MDGSFRAREPMQCLTTPRKQPSVYCGCCAKARSVQSKAETSRCAAKQFVFTAIHLAPSNSHANSAHDWNAKALKSARRRVRDENDIVILSEAKTLRSAFPTSPRKRQDF